jgi:N-acetylglucosaminyldiphosphoundecaprenol N-acetyl-beta-D-mannosaminyltransferase
MNAKFRLGFASIDRLDRQGAVEAVIAAAESRKPSFVVTPNSDHIVRLESDTKLRTVYEHADIVVADGMPLVWASRLLGSPLKERVTGADLMPALCEQAAKRGLRVFLLGAQDGVAKKAQERLEQSYPGLKVVGVYSPPFGFEKDAESNLQIVSLIREAAPDMIFVGLGAPKQEIWIFENYQSFSHGVFLGIGASIDFIAGQVKRAPLWVQNLGCEWLYRLFQEPKRLARRYAGDTYILWIVLREFFRKKS